MLTEKAQKSKEELEETEKKIFEYDQELGSLNKKRVEKEAVLNYLTEQANTMQRRLTAAKKLITGLAREKSRWTEDRKKLLELVIKLVGDCLSCSSFLSYAGPFDYTFRKKMVYEHWREDIIKKQLPNSETFRLEDLLTSEVEIS